MSDTNEAAPSNANAAKGAIKAASGLNAPIPPPPPPLLPTKKYKSETEIKSLPSYQAGRIQNAITSEFPALICNLYCIFKLFEWQRE